MKKLKTGESRPVSRTKKKRGQLGEIWHRIKKNKGAVVGLIILAILVLLLIISLFMPFKLVTSGSGKIRFTEPCWQYPFGTDNQGRNVFYRVIYGTRYSLAIGLGSVAVGLVFGIIAGAYAGYKGGRVDDIILRCSDVLASIPGMLLGMVIVTVLGTSVRNLIIAVGVQCVPQFLRITRASVLTIKDNEFVEAAKAIGFSDTRILFTQVLPNGLSPVIVLISTDTRHGYHPSGFPLLSRLRRAGATPGMGRDDFLQSRFYPYTTIFDYLPRPIHYGHGVSLQPLSVMA